MNTKNSDTPGTYYPCRALGAGDETAVFGKSASGYCYWAIRIALPDGSQITANLYFTEKTAERSQESLEHMGCTFPNGDVTDLTGLGSRDFEAVLKNDSYIGNDGIERDSVNVAWINRGGVMVRNVVGATEKAAFAASFRANVLKRKQDQAAKSPAGPPASPSTSSAAPPPFASSKDPVPF